LSKWVVEAVNIWSEADKPTLREIEDVLKRNFGFGWASREELAVETGIEGL